jgi:phosphoglycolate phosphatase-like HAD superfamily hydrolase
MMLLFDVDGTLVRVGGAGRRALARAFESILGVKEAMNGVRLDGSTDFAIIESAFRVHLGRAPRDREEIETLLQAYLGFLELELEASRAMYEVLPGASELARAACASGRCAVGLATGNIERGARLKLARAGLNESFSFGGFGSDAASRPDLVACAVERGQRFGEARFGRRFPPEEIFVIGDTELDVAAARAVGAVAVGVLAGCMVRDALIASKPDFLLDSLDAEVFWTRVGLAKP